MESPEARLLIPGQEAALIIGKEGSTIRKIRDASGASVRIVEKDLPDSLRHRDERVLYLGGDGEELKAALRGINEVVRLDELNFLIPEAAVPHLIGIKGERIRNLIQSSGCDLQLAKQGIPGIHATRRMTIVAQDGQLWDGLRETNGVLAELQKSGFLDPQHFELLDDSLPDVPKWVDGLPLRFLSDEEETSWIIGKNGNKVSKYRDICKISVDEVPGDFDSASRCITLDQTKGPDAQKRVLQLMLDDLGIRLNPGSETRILVPSEVAGKVVGRGEENIRDIEKEWKVKITAPSPEEYKPDRILYLNGDVTGRVESTMAIQRLIQENRKDKKGAMNVANMAWGRDSNTKRNWSTPDTTNMNSRSIQKADNSVSGKSFFNAPAVKDSRNNGSFGAMETTSADSWVRGAAGSKPETGKIQGITSAKHINWTVDSKSRSETDNSSAHSSQKENKTEDPWTAPIASKPSKPPPKRTDPPKGQKQPMLNWSSAIPRNGPTDSNKKTFQSFSSNTEKVQDSSSNTNQSSNRTFQSFTSSTTSSTRDSALSFTTGGMDKDRKSFQSVTTPATNSRAFSSSGFHDQGTSKASENQTPVHSFNSIRRENFDSSKPSEGNQIPNQSIRTGQSVSGIYTSGSNSNLGTASFTSASILQEKNNGLTRTISGGDHNTENSTNAHTSPVSSPYGPVHNFTLKVKIPSDKILPKSDYDTLAKRCQVSLLVESDGIVITGSSVGNALCTLYLQNVY